MPNTGFYCLDNDGRTERESNPRINDVRRLDEFGDVLRIEHRPESELSTASDVLDYLETINYWD